MNQRLLHLWFTIIPSKVWTPHYVRCEVSDVEGKVRVSAPNQHVLCSIVIKMMWHWRRANRIYSSGSPWAKFVGTCGPFLCFTQKLKGTCWNAAAGLWPLWNYTTSFTIYAKLQQPHTHANNKKASTDTDNSSITNKLTNVSIFEIEERVTIVVYAHLKLEKAEMLWEFNHISYNNHSLFSETVTTTRLCPGAASLTFSLSSMANHKQCVLL